MADDERLSRAPNVASVRIADVERLFYTEAALLDEWRLEEWLNLLTEDAVYRIPGLARLPGEPALVDDDMVRIKGRVKQLLSHGVVSEAPFSRTRRLVTNVRIVRADGDALEVTANFLIHRFKHEKMEVFVGSYANQLVLSDGELKIRARCAILDHEALRPHGKIAIIL